MKVLQELPKPLSMILEKPLQSDEVLGDLKKGNSVPVFKNSRKVELRTDLSASPLCLRRL